MNWDKWFRKHDPRKKREDDERRKRLSLTDSIYKRQKSGEITHEQASLEFDELLMANDPSTLIYYSDSTGLTASWDADLMLFPKPGSTTTNRIPGNTGIYARGPKRGWMFTLPGETPDSLPEVIKHFSPGRKGWINGPVDAVEATQPEQAEKPGEAKP